MRPGTWGDEESLPATSPSGTPSPRAHAAAASAFATLKSPSSGKEISAAPKHPSSRNRLPAASRTIPAARTSAAGCTPNVTRRERIGSTSQATSSRLTTSTPESASMLPNLSLAARYDSIVA